MISVVHIVEDLKIGGLERIIAALVTGLDSSTFNVRIWCLAGKGEIFEELAVLGAKIEYFGMRSPRDISILFKLGGKLKDENIQVVHTHGYTATTMGRLAAILANVPVIISHRHTDHSELTFKRLAIEKLLNLFTAKIICCSEAVARYVVSKEGVSPSKVEVIYNGTGIIGVQEKGSDNHEGKEEFMVGCVASLFPHKGHKDLLKAAALVEKRIPNKVKFVFVGTGVLEQELRAYAQELGLSDRVIFYGQASDIVSVVSFFDAVVLASTVREGLGLSLIEAMALAKPVIGTSVGGIPEVIENGKNGLLVKPQDPVSLAEAIISLASDRARAREMGKEGQRIAREKFSFSGMVKKTEDLYLRLLGHRGRKEKFIVLYTSSFASLQGGGQRSLLLLLKFLDKERFQPLLLVPEEGELSREAGKLGISHRVLAFPRARSLRIWRNVIFFSRLRKLIREQQIDLIHTESPREALYCGLAGKFAHVPVILHARVAESTQLLDRILYRLADRIITVSQAVADRFIFAPNDLKVRLVYNGVDLQEYKLSGQQAPNSVFTVGYFGRIHPRKGIEVLVKAMQRLNGPAQLIIQGDGDAKYLASLKDLTKGSQAQFRAYSADPAKEIAGVDAVVVPSIRREGLSRVILESMAMGKIIIASDLPENKEAIGQDSNQFTFPLGDAVKLAEIIEGIRQNKVAAADTVLKHRKRAERLFDVRKNTRQIEDIYKSLLGLEKSDFLPDEKASGDPGKAQEQTYFACPDCLSRLVLSNDLYFCAECSSQWPVKDGIPVFLKQAPDYWGEFSLEEMRRINVKAKETGWNNVVQSEFPPHLRDFVLEDSRSNWQYFVESNTAGSVLDAGSGWGTLAFSFARTAATVYALEPVWERIQFIKIRQEQEKLINLRPVCAGIQALPFPDSSFDLVILNGVLEWLGTAESDLAPGLVQEKCLKEIFRVLKPGGSLYIGIENRFAFFYFLGVKDPHTRTPFTTIAPRAVANLICLSLKHKTYRTYIYSLNGYRKLLLKVGFEEADFYLPAPSYLRIKYLVPLKGNGVFCFWIRRLLRVNLLFSPLLVRVVFVLVKMFAHCPLANKLLKYFVPDYAIIARKNCANEN